MRILWLGHNLAYPPKGGPLQRNYNLLREAAREHEVHALVFDQPASRPKGVTPQDCVEALSKFCASVDWVPLPTDAFGGRYWRAINGLVTGEPYEFKWLRSKEMVKRLQRLMSRVRFDVVHADTIGLSPYVALIPHAGTILNHHDVESALVRRRASHERNVLWRAFWSQEAAHLLAAEQRWCPTFDVNVVVSEDEGQLVKASCGGSAICVVPNGVDVHYFTPRPDPGGARLLFCGRLDQLANRGAITYFFQSIWPELSGRVKHLEIDVVGKNAPAWLVELAQRDQRVHVPGFVDDVRPYFKKATLFVCPITDGGGTRLKILDALAMGMPIVSTTFAASGLKLRDGEHLLLADNSGTFVEQVLHVLSDRELRGKLAESACDIAKRIYSWDTIGRSLVAAYEQAAVRKATGRILTDTHLSLTKKLS
ncbi:MAG: glycosyltransferase [Nitrospira sp. CR2.1]|nr:glycosyltransferase [Nitrospira sp. CR2.1]MBA5874302.1 glycosyltransferase [Nitrospira sp. CR1.2]